MRNTFLVAQIIMLCLLGTAFAQDLQPENKTPALDVNNVILDSNIEILEFTDEIIIGEPIEINSKVTNTGQAIWRNDEFFFKIPRVELIDSTGESTEAEDLTYQGYEFAHDIYPGESFIMHIKIKTGEDCVINGNYETVIISQQMLRAGYCWFGPEEKVRIIIINQ